MAFFELNQLSSITSRCMKEYYMGYVAETEVSLPWRNGHVLVCT